MSVLLCNGSHSEFIDLVRYTLADADNVTLTIPDSNIANENLHIQQGASARQSAKFLVDNNLHRPIDRSMRDVRRQERV